jgi:hypothetical protein
VVPHLFAVRVSVIYMDGFAKDYITNIGCEIYSLRVKYSALLEML